MEPTEAGASQVDPYGDEDWWGTVEISPPPRQDSVGTVPRVLPRDSGQNHLLANGSVDVCPRAWSPPRRVHEWFGNWSGPPRAAVDRVERFPLYQLPEVPFGEQDLLLDMAGWYCVVLGPGYRLRPNEPPWIVQMTLRDIYRELIYDAACKKLHPQRFLRRYVEVSMPGRSSGEFCACLPLLLSLFPTVSVDSIDWQRSHCLAPAIPETEAQMLQDYERRFFAFDLENRNYPRVGAFRSWSNCPGYRRPWIRLVVEWVPSTPESAELRRNRDCRVRYPTELPRVPGARAAVFPGPSAFGVFQDYDPPPCDWVASPR
ncbi:hypothetical protein Emed_007621 [Eimeria media]